MRQYLYNIFLMVGIVLLTISCSKDHLILDDDLGPGNNGNGTGDNISLIMTIPLPEGTSFTKSYTGTNKGSTFGEILIKDVRFVFYGDDNTVKYKWDLNIGLDVDGLNNVTVTGSDVHNWFTYNQSILIQTSAKTMTRGDYRMLIIINPNTKIKEKTETEKLISELDAPFDTKDIYSSRTVNGGTEPAYFLMLNSQGFIKIEPNNFYETKEKAQENPVYATVERVAAKVGCDYVGPTTRSTEVAPYGRFVMLLDYNNQTTAPWGTDYDIPEDCVDCPVYGCNGKFDLQTKKCSIKPYIHTYDGLGLVADRVRYMVVTDLTWHIDIVNKKSFWLRSLTNKAGGALEKPGDRDRINFYAEDPNFSGFSGTGSLDDEFNYIISDSLNPNITGSTARKLFPPSSYKYINYWSWDEADSDPVYIPENTMEQNEQKGDVTTRVIFKAILRREQFGADETEPIPTNPERIGDFFVFKGGNTNIEDYKYNNYNKDGSTFYILRPEDVAIYESPATTTDNIHIYLRDGIKAAIAQFKSDNPDFRWDNIAANAKPAISQNLIFYKNGEIYYEVPIEHFSVSESGSIGGYGRFGVVRNNWYKLNIENIISIGKPTLPQPTSELIEKTSPGGARTKSATDSDSQIRTQSIIF